jgi:hypothetical protein
MADAVSPELTWDGREWVGAVSVPYFKGVGREFLNPLRDEVLRPWGGFSSNAEAQANSEPEKPSDDPLDYDVLFRDGMFRIRFDVGDRKKAVAKPQLKAWEMVAARGDAIWHDAMERVLADYQIQRPIRVKWWKAVFGDLPFERELPEIADIEALKKYCRPYSIKVQPAAKGMKMPDISVHVMCTWIREGFSLRLREGSVEAVEATQDGWHERPPREIEHPAFGRLRLLRNLTTWVGEMTCPPMLEYQRIVEERAKFREEGVNRERPQSLMWWRFAHGKFGLSVYVTEPSADPDERQAAAFLAFKQNEQQNIATIIDALFKRYNERLEENYRDYDRKYVNEAIPHLETPDRFREMIELINVYVHPADEKGDVRIVFELHCSFELSCIILWKNGKIERFGKWGDHRPAQ